MNRLLVAGVTVGPAGFAILSVASLLSCSNETTGPGSSSPPPVASVVVTPQTSTIGPGETVHLSAVPKDAAGNTLSGRTITWSTSDASVAMVSTAGLVTGVAAGSATISSTAEGKAGQSAITVKFINIGGVWDFTETLVDLAQGITCSDTGSYVFSQTGSAFEGTYGQVGTCVQGASSFPNDTVSVPVTGGHVTVAAATIVFQVPGCQYGATVSGDPPTSLSGAVSCFSGQVSGSWRAVRGVAVASVAVTPATATVLGSETAQLSVAVKNAAGARLFGRPVTWSSGDQSIATVSATGIVTGLAAGTTTITATVEGKGSSASVTSLAFVDLPSPIAFHSNRSGNYEIYVMARGGAPLQGLTHTTANSGQPSWSPDGAKIAFASDLYGNYDIYVMNADGTTPIRLTNNPTYDYWPAWSPDGAKLAFVSDRDGNFEIYVMNADGTNPTRLTSNSTVDFSPAWSPDGTRIAFQCDPDGTANLEICVINADGTNLVRLTNNPALDEFPAWSRDGSKILFTSLRNGNSDLFIMNRDGTGVTPITGNPATDEDGDWKP